MLSKTEQLILLDMLKKKQVNEKFSFDNQRLIKDQPAFCKIMTNLAKNEMINREHRHRTSYSFTDYGYLMALLLNKHYNTPEQYREIDKHVVNWFVD
jgi:hypothetical protein